MIKKYILAGLLILFPVSAFADGGLPLWINTIQTVAATSGIKGLGVPVVKFHDYAHLFDINYIL